MLLGACAAAVLCGFPWVLLGPKVVPPTLTLYDPDEELNARFAVLEEAERRRQPVEQVSADVFHRSLYACFKYCDACKKETVWSEMNQRCRICFRPIESQLALCPAPVVRAEATYKGKVWAVEELKTKSVDRQEANRIERDRHYDEVQRQTDDIIRQAIYLD